MVTIRQWHDKKFTPGTPAKSYASVNARREDMIKEILAKFKSPEANSYVVNGRISHYLKAPTMFILGSKKK